jgi:anti-sigma factor RsiW
MSHDDIMKDGKVGYRLDPQPSVLGTPSLAVAPPVCPADELLAAYLTTGLSDTERSAIDGHVRACNRCVRELTTAQRRLALDAEISAPLPAAVLDRLRIPPQPSPALRAQPSMVNWLWQQLSALLQVPVFVPLAAAALALFFVVTQYPGWMGTSPRDMTRAVHTSTTLRVSIAEAPVRERPAIRQPVVATLRRGDEVAIAGEEDDWYHVVLPDGTQGWMERRAFE